MLCGTLAERKGQNLSEELWTELEKLDVLRERMGISYEEARAALNLADGDVVRALDDLENAHVEQKNQYWDFADCGNGILESVKSTLASFKKSTISLKRNDNTIVSLSAPLGVALAYTVWRKPSLRLLALVGAVGAAMNHFELEVDTHDGNSYNDDAFNFSTDEV